MALSYEYLKGIQNKNGGASSSKTASSSKGDGGLSYEYLKGIQQNRVSVQDIAPIRTTTTTKKKKKKKDEEKEGLLSGWFKDSEYFADGSWDKGDLTKTILGTGTDAGEDLSTGVLGMGEKFVDFLANVGTLMSGQQMQQAAQNEMMYNAMTGKKSDGVLENYQSYQKQVEKETTEFVKKDLYDEEKIAKKIITNPFEKATGIDVEGASVFDVKSDSLIQSGGQLLATAGLQMAGVPWFLTTGATAYGSQAEQSLREGATFQEANASALISSGAEILTEKLSGGIKFGGKTLDDVLLKPLTEKITSKTLKTLTNLGLDAVGEGSEEVVSSVLSNLGTALYKEDKLSDILFSEEAVNEYIDSFIGGMALGGVSSGFRAIRNGVEETYTENEQKVIDKEIENRIAEEEQDGNTLTKKDKNKIREDVLRDLDKGYISIDTIESVLGGETYDNYKSTVDREDALLKEFEELGERTNATLKEQARYKELEGLYNELKNSSQRSQLKSQLSDEVYNLAKNSRLAESYNERARLSEDFQADFSKFKGVKHEDAAKKTLENAIKVGANNTNRIRDLVEMNARVSGDLGIVFEYKSNEQIKNDFIERQIKEISKIESIPEAQRTDEQNNLLTELKDTLEKVKSGKVTVNGDITADSIVINLDSAKALNRLTGHEITHSLEKAKNYNELRDHLFAYAKAKGVDIDSELAILKSKYQGIANANPEAELVADLVGDYLFTDADFINSLSTEKPNVFKRIYNEIKYLCKIATAGSKEARELEKVKRAFDKAYKESANTKTKADTNTKHSLSDNHKEKQLDIINKYHPKADWDYQTWITSVDDIKTFAETVEDESNYATTPDFTDDDVAKALKTGIVKVYSSHDIRNGTFVTPSYMEAKNYAGQGKVNYKIVNLTDVAWIDSLQGQYAPVETDTKYSLTEEQENYFKDSKVRDENGNLKVMYHGTSKGGHTVFDTYGSNYGLFGQGSYFTDNKSVAESYTNKGNGNNKQVYESYLNITNPLDMDAEANPEEWKKAFDFDAIDFPESGTNEQFFRAVEQYYSDEMMYKWEIAEIIQSTIQDRMGYDGITHIGGGRFNKKDDTRHQVYIAFEPEQIKNIDNIAPTKDADIRYSLSETDKTYLSAVEKGDTETAQRLVDEVAKENGYTRKMFHETDAENIHIFDTSLGTHGATDSETPYGIFTKSSDKNIGLGSIQMSLYVKADNTLYVENREEVKAKIPELIPYYDEIARIDKEYEALAEEFENAEFDALSEWMDENPDADMDVVYPTQYIIDKKPADIDSQKYLDAFSKHERIMEEWSEEYNKVAIKCKEFITSYLRNNGYDSMYFKIDAGSRGRQTDSLILLDSNQVKSADAVTYDDKGNVIPLSERFKTDNEDIRYSISTEKIPFAKTVKTTTPTNANLQKDAFTVRDVRSKTMIENNYTQDDVKQVNKFMDNLATFMEKAGVTYKFIGLEDVNNARVKVVYDRDGTPMRITMSAMVKNGDYPVNFDLTSICKKRQSMSMVIQELASRKNGDGTRALDEIELDADALWTINEELRKAGLETACLGCFVESKRYNIQNFANKATTMWNNIVDEVRREQGKTQPVENFNFAEGVDLDSVDYMKVDEIFKAYKTEKGRSSPEARMRALIKNGGEIYQRYLQPSDLMTPEGVEGIKSLSTKDNDFYGIIKGAYGQAAPKEIMGFSPYNSEIALLPNKKGNRDMSEYIASIGGVRMQSFSDFLVSNVYDYMQMVADLSARHLPAHAYTKEIAFAKIFGMTGIKINMSVMFDIDSSLPNEYAGLRFVPDANGDEIYDGVRGRFEYLVGDQKRSDEMLAETGERTYVQSIGFDEAVELQNTEGYSGNIGIIGVGFSDKHIIKMLGDNNIRYVIPYHSSSLPTVIKDVTNIAKATDYTNDQNTRTSDGEALVGLGGFDVYKDVEQTRNPKETAQNYLKYCEKNKYTPVFSQFAEHENYYKLLFDFDPYDTLTGEYSPQTEVKNIYKGYNAKEGLTSTEEIEKIIDDEMAMQNEINRQRNAKLPSVVDSVLEHLGVSHDKVGFSLSIEEGETFRERGNFDVYGKDFKVQDDIAPTVSKMERVAPVGVAKNTTTTLEDIAPMQEPVEDIVPTKEYEAIEPMPEKQPKMVRADNVDDDTEGAKPLKRSELHNNIVEGIKTKFAEKGLDFDKILSKAKNLSTFATVDNTPQRVMEKALGYKEGQVLADETVNKVAQNETEGIKWLNSFTDRKNGVLAQLSKQYNIKPGSKKSAAAQMYAEGFYVNENNEIIEYGDKELAKDFPNPKDREDIKGLANDPRIRQIYDETLSAINESRSRNAYPEIQRLDNYFLHFRAMEDTFSRLGLPFNPNDIRAKDLPTDLNGVTADLKPGQPYFASAMHRTGMRTSFDLLGGLERYLSSAKNQIYHIDDIQTLRALRNYIADTYGQAKGLESLDNLAEEEIQERIKQVYGSHLSTFAKFLNEEANVLAGKTTLIDRGLEGIIGRRGITFLDTVNKQVGSNMVGFNVSSSLTNILPVVQTFAKTNKFDFVKALAQTTSDRLNSLVGKSDGFKENSPVIIRRKGADRFYRTPFQKVGDTGYILMSAVDDISTEIIARTKYNELTRKGMDSQQAHFETDKWVSRLMGDRSLGQQPQIFNSKMLGMVTKFQLEVRNQLDSQFYDTIQEAKVSNEEIEDVLLRNAKTSAKVVSTFFQLAVMQHLFGKAFESVAGYNPAFDIIEALIKTFGLDDDEDDEDTVLNNIEEGFLTLLDDLPYASTFTGGRIPISAALPIKELVKGEDDYGNEVSRWGTIKETAPYYLLPTGYGQVKKTIQGLKMFDDDLPIAGSYTDSGNLRFPVEDNLKNRVQAGVFGQWANENARAYFDNDIAPLKEKQIKEYIDVDMPIKDYWKYREGLKDFSKQDEKVAYINGLDVTEEQKNVLKSYLYDEEGYKEKNPEKYAFLESEGIGFLGYKELDEETQSSWSWAFKHQDEYRHLKENGVYPEDYSVYYVPMQEFDDEGDEAYTWAFDNPEKATLGKVFSNGVKEYKQYTSDLYNIRADKKANGKTISGSAKRKKKEYIWNLDIDDGAKYILFKSEYNADDTYNDDIVEYLLARDDISAEEMTTILEELGATVDAEGYIYW